MSLMHVLKSRIFVLVIVSGMQFLTACNKQRKQSESSEQKRVSIALGYRPTVVVDLALLQSIDRGVFRNAGIDVTMKPYGRADLLFAALNSGEIQGSVGVPLEPLLGMASKGDYPYRAYLIWYFDAKTAYDGFLVLKDSPVRVLADLKGKVVGSHPSKQVKYFVSKIVPDAKVQEYNPATPLLSLKSGDQAAAYVLEPSITLATASGEYRLVEPAAISRCIFDNARVPAAVSVLKDKWISEHPTEAAKFVRIAREAFQADVRKRDTHAVTALLARKEFGGYSPEVAAKVVEPAASLPEELDRNRLQQFFDTLRDGKLLEGSIDIEKLLYVLPVK